MHLQHPQRAESSRLLREVEERLMSTPGHVPFSPILKSTLGTHTHTHAFTHLCTRTRTHAHTHAHWTRPLQRAESNRLLREVEERLMIAQDLVPACHILYRTHTHTLDTRPLQRAESNRLLREVEKRLMIAQDLVPASPLLPHSAQQQAQSPVAATNLDVKSRLLERKERLEAQVGGVGSPAMCCVGRRS